MRSDALVLTPWMTPHKITPWYDSIAGVLGGKTIALESYDQEISSQFLTVRIPAVVVVKKALARTKKDVKFSRPNVYARDHHTCQYCGHRFAPKDLTRDHVFPRSRGGKTVWENIVTACSPCNLRKDDRTPKEAGMRLLRAPFRPSSLPLTGLVVLPKEIPPLWMPYLEGQRELAFEMAAAG